MEGQIKPATSPVPVHAPKQHAWPAGSHLVTDGKAEGKERAMAKQQIAQALIYNTECHSYLLLRTNITKKITALQIKAKG